MRDHAPASSLSEPQVARDLTRCQGRIARDFRVELCLTQVELAASINTTVTDISMLERGLYPLGGRTNNRMCRHFTKVQDFCEAQAVAPVRHAASPPNPERPPRSTKVPSSGNLPSVPTRALGPFEDEKPKPYFMSTAQKSAERAERGLLKEDRAARPEKRLMKLREPHPVWELIGDVIGAAAVFVLLFCALFFAGVYQ